MVSGDQTLDGLRTKHQPFDELQSKRFNYLVFRDKQIPLINLFIIIVDMKR